jgi:2-haloacid dehalogenase
MTAKPWVTFDCYGTLVTWNEGLCEAFGRMLGREAGDAIIGDLLAVFKPIQFEMMQGPYRSLKEILPDALHQAMNRLHLSYQERFGDDLMAAVASCGPFPEVPTALNKIRSKYRIAIISNSDDDIIESNVRAIGVPFDEVITAQQARAYKPQYAIFQYLFEKLGSRPEDIVHVAAGFIFDIEPAASFGTPRVWINRAGIAGDPKFGPYSELPDLSGLPQLLEIHP